MSSLIKTIAASDLKKYITTSKDVFFDSVSCILQPKTGCVSFDFVDELVNSCIIKFKRNSGNGIVFLSSSDRSKGFQVHSISGQNIAYDLVDRKLQINRTIRSRGDLSILEISLYSEAVGAIKRKPENIVVPTLQRSKRHVSLPVIPRETSLKPFNNSQNKIEKLNGSYLSGDSLQQNSVLETSLTFSSFSGEKYKVDDPMSLSGSISINTFNGMQWINRVAPFIPNIKINNDNFNSSISYIGNLISAKNMYLQAFSEEIPQTDIDILNNIPIKIITSSNQNADILREKVKNKKIIVSAKSLPNIPSTPLKHIKTDSYILFKNKNADITNYILDSIESLGINVVLLNARGKYPSFVFPTNEYIEYSNLLYLFENAKCYIDIPLLVEDYQSSEVELALGMGVPVITSSWAYMENPDVLFLNMKNKIGKYSAPEAGDIKEMISLNRINKHAIPTNDAFKEFITSLVV